MRRTVRCRDGYEAQKLASMIFGESRETFVWKILNVYGCEMVVSLKDKSAHSIVLADEAQVEALADFMQSVLERMHRITMAEASDSAVEILKE
jgi:hypothetical protein